MHYDSLIQIRDRLVAGEVTSVQVTSALLQRIAALEGDLKAFALILKERALAQAEALDQKLAAGGKPGPLHGVPIAVKDLIYLQGYPNASGTRVMADFVPTFDATVLERLEQAGAVVVGKTQLTEGAFGSHHPDIDPPRNP